MNPLGDIVNALWVTYDTFFRNLNKMSEARDTGTQHKLRMPPELKQKIAASAKEHNRSMNADIVARLEQSFSQSGTNSSDFDKFISFLEQVVIGSPSNPTTDALAAVLNAWKSQKKGINHA